MKYGIQVGVADFSTEGTFCARLSDVWNEEREKNPNFGRSKGKSEICLWDIDYIYDALKEGELMPYTSPYHLRLLICFILLRFFGLRTVEAKVKDG